MGDSARAGNFETWTTNGVRQVDLLPYWQQAIRESTCGLFGLSNEAAPPRFSARMRLRSSGSFRFLLGESTTMFQVTRTRRDIAHTRSDHFSIYLKLAGRTVSLTDGEAVTLDAGDIGLCDGRLPLYTEQEGRGAVAMLPLAMVEARAPWLRGQPYRKLGATARFVDHLRLHLRELMADAAPLGDTGTGLLVESLCNLVALATADDLPTGRLQPELQLEALLAFCRQNLHDARLSPRLAADHLGISVRTLHARFRQTGETFGRWVLESRLQRCCTALRDPAQQTLNISEIAYRWGFNDLSYFNKAFRSRFDMSPTEWRATPRLSW